MYVKLSNFCVAIMLGEKTLDLERIMKEKKQRHMICGNSYHELGLSPFTYKIEKKKKKKKAKKKKKKKRKKKKKKT